jgi:hypothetical protein
MRYVIVDPEGSTRARLENLRAVRDWTRAQKARDPELLDELILLTFDASGDEVANQWLSDYAPDIPELVIVALVEATPSRELMGADVAGSVLSEDWSGTAIPTAL